MEREQFERVWRRVAAGTEQPDEEERLHGEITEAYALLLAYELLRQRRVREGERFAREKRAELKRLQGEYFLRTGERCPVRKELGKQEGTLQLLRFAALGEERAAETYRRHSADALPRMRDTYGDFARRAAARSEGLREQILQSMGLG